MAPELLLTMEANELRELAGKVLDYQTARGLSDTALARKLPGIGSTKTYKRILADDLKELDLENQLNNYRAVVAEIESTITDEEEAEEIYKDFLGVTELLRVFYDTSKETGIARAIFILGPEGSGKTSARKALMEKHPNRFLLLRASVTWNDRPAAMLAELLKLLGVREVPLFQVDRLEKAVEMLGKKRRGLMIEDGHNLGPNCLNLLIELIDKTPGEMLIFAIDTLWRRLEKDAFEECRQLKGNRLSAKILLTGAPVEADVEKMLQRRIKWEDGEQVKKAVRLVMEKSKNYSGLSFARNVCKKAARKAIKEPVSWEIFHAAIEEEVKSR